MNTSDESHSGLPVLGYQDQPNNAVTTVNDNKIMEAFVLKQLETIAQNPEVDPRWLSIAKTHIEQAFMAANRAVFKPQPVDLDFDSLESLASELVFGENN